MINPEEIYQRLIVQGDDWSDKNAAAELLEENKHSVLAEITLKMEGKSQAEKESKARASSEYKGHLKSMVEARRLSNRAKVRYDSAKSWQENIRTAESTRRAEMKL